MIIWASRVLHRKDKGLAPYSYVVRSYIGKVRESVFSAIKISR